MPVLDLVDDTYVDVPPAHLAALVRDARRWPLWWPDLVLEVTRDRGVKGVQWEARPAPGAGRRRRRGALPDVRWVGTAEIWLEPWRERGTVLHHYQRLDPVGHLAPTPRTVDRLRTRRATAWKQHVHRLKDEAEGQVGTGTGRSTPG